jgi:hypothetical protein
LVAASEGVEEKQELGFRGGAQPPYIDRNPNTQTCPGPEPDMSGKNWLGSFINFGNCLK